MKVWHGIGQSVGPNGWIDFAAASKHVAVPERAGLVTRERRGREHHITINEHSLHEAADWATRTAAFWSRRLDPLEDYLNSNGKGTDQ